MKAKRILIFDVNWLGDVLFSTAAIRNIRFNFPDSFIACVVPSSCHPILKDNPHLDEIIIFDEKGKDKGVFAKLSFVRLLKSKRFDIAFLLHRSFSRALICRLAGIPERIGYITKKRSFLLTKKIKPPRKDDLHRIDYYMNIVEKAGFSVKDRYTEFFVSADDEKFVEDFLKNNFHNTKFLAGINPAGNWLPKRWPKEHWAVLADRLMEDFSASLIITGSRLDIPLAADIQALMKNKPLVACGAFNLKQLGALCKRLDLFISADSGPLHIANAVGAKKIIALFGPTSASVTGPYPAKNVDIVQIDSGCIIPCYRKNCKDNRCMRIISPKQVIEKIKTLKL